MGLSKKRRDKDFCVFESMRWGYRAAYMTIRSYMKKHNKYTIREIIARWAPPSENDTESYIKTVARLSLMPADERLDFNNMTQMLMLVSAMTVVECGSNYNPQDNPEYWKAMYDGYIDVRG